MWSFDEEGNSVTVLRETHIGTVTDNNDDEKRGRIKFSCASLLGVDPESGEAREFPSFVDPKFPQLISGDDNGEVSGFFGVPSEGTTVEVEVVVSSERDQSPEQSSIASMDPKWIACLLNQGEKLSSDFTKNYPDRMGWRSKSGHFIIFDDKADEIILNHNDKETQVVFTKGQISAKAKLVLVGDGADSPIVRHKEWVTWVVAHTHPTVFGPSGAPIVPPPPTIASTKAKVK